MSPMMVPKKNRHSEGAEGAENGRSSTYMVDVDAQVGIDFVPFGLYC